MNSSSEVIVLLKSIFIASLVGSLVIYLIIAISYSKIFKANGEKGWKGFIPIVNIWTLMKLSDMNPLAIFLLIIPIVNLFVLALLSVKLANKFSKSAGFAIGLLFLPFIFYPLLALSFSPKKEKLTKEETKEDEKTVICPVCGTELKNGEKKCYVCDAEIETNKEIENENDKQINTVEDEKTLESNTQSSSFNNSFENVSDNTVENGIENYSFDNNSENVNTDIVENNTQDYSFNNAFENNYNDVIDNNSYNEIKQNENIIENLDNGMLKNDTIEDNINAGYNNIEHNKEIYRNPLDSNFDDLFLRNNNENVLSKELVKEDERKFNEKVNNDELNISEIGIIDNYNTNLNTIPNIKVEEKPKYKSSTKTLDEILKINQNLYQNTNVNKINDESKNIDVEKKDNNDELMDKINELNKEIEEGLKEIREEEPKVKICNVCGTTIPSYSEKCLLCGSPVE